MALTKDFKRTVQEIALKNSKFRKGLLVSSVNELLLGELGSAKILMKDYINATIGFISLAEKMGKNNKTLHKMFGNNGNPTAENLCAIFKILQEHEGIKIHANLLRNHHRAA
jgi:DNA-binding phage protein